MDVSKCGKKCLFGEMYLDDEVLGMVLSWREFKEAIGNFLYTKDSFVHRELQLATFARLISEFD